MLRNLLFFLILFASITITAQVDQAVVDQFAVEFSKKHGTPINDVNAILAKATFQAEIIAKISRPAEGTMTWERYRKIFITEERANAGVEFWGENEVALNKVSNDTGVPVEVILGIIGVETYFGRIKGSYKVLDALYTLGFGYPQRSKFFKSELDHFLVLAKEENLDVANIQGSYAGAMGYSQFMPSSYRAYAKSFEKGGTRDLMNSPEDAIASVANYLKVHRWKKGQPITSKANLTREISNLNKQSLRPKNKVADYTAIGFESAESLNPTLPTTMIILEGEQGTEHWFGMYNFYVITRYNHSKLYAMAVFQLSEMIKSKRQ
jgi:peptidoglycan lytic transglycosylase B